MERKRKRGNGVWPNGMAAVFGTVDYGFESYDSKRKERVMWKKKTRKKKEKKREKCGKNEKSIK